MPYQSQFKEFVKDNPALIEDLPITTVEQIFEAGRLSERENVLDLISRGILTIK